jgi:hypothetical protein
MSSLRMMWLAYFVAVAALQLAGTSTANSYLAIVAGERCGLGAARDRDQGRAYETAVQRCRTSNGFVGEDESCRDPARNRFALREGRVCASFARRPLSGNPDSNFRECDLRKLGAHTYAGSPWVSARVAGRVAEALAEAKCEDKWKAPNICSQKVTICDY